ncbi:MAG TPA: phosphate/phosphite/phosphonate ABC transporter substrate-binding protein [Ignavibacteriales bacterium]|nr:phosphate/phosphite/phosphonate ABC transporter substrate-binding protein [Ignavibacteriales bacterium]HOL82155.1 phosphate/phosphite/phosphonate ABC transporter substrate-binding protein [Ignavibacteriales bacterium]HPP34283.1 phosphate/phosphite/phosphonate ABC transporter substrate-binding protein [Ignavibacteriales bacterium]
MKYLKYLLYLSPIIIFTIWSIKKDLSKNELGTKSNPIKFYFTPSVDANTITTNAKELMEFLHKKTGYYFETAVPSSYIAVIEAFGTDKADICILNPFAYLLGNKKFGIEARLRLVRVGGETSFKSQIITRYDSGIKTLEDLNGKKFAFVDPSSTTGYVLPKALLKKHNIKLADEVFAMKHDNVVTMIYQKQVDAGATYYSSPDPETGEIQDARVRVKKQFPDIEKVVKIIAFTEETPNDLVVFRKNLPEEMKEKIAQALIEFVKTPNGVEALKKIYGIIGFVRTKDSDYDHLREVVSKSDITLEKVVK